VRPMFILGQGYPHGKWFYFPVLLALKLTLGSIVIAATALLLTVGVMAMRLAPASATPAVAQRRVATSRPRAVTSIRAAVCKNLLL